LRGAAVFAGQVAVMERPPALDVGRRCLFSAIFIGMINAPLSAAIVIALIIAWVFIGIALLS
jgi:hypothetical protein